MSWSVKLIGSPTKICEALDAQSEKLTDYCKQEFDLALPHIKSLVAMNYIKPEYRRGETAFELQASGMGSYHVESKELLSSSLEVSLKPVFARIV
jgi:hypothetical protein